ncbi:MAG TPA: TauD/TfdA family dioxygenase [Acetobacteraceae bacterium]|nr:TauD/TfdA family dioxygenase [Acetobacteraceae bacterium]
MADRFKLARPLPGARFGGRLALRGDGGDADALIAAAEAAPGVLTKALAESRGLLLIPGMDAIIDTPDLLVRLSRLFGAEVEDYRHTLTPRHMVHAMVPEIFVVSNMPPANRPPPRRPDPPLTTTGKLPVQFPHRRGWHTDQSYRRPPPDISLFLAVIPAPQGQAQTIFADCTAAYEELAPELKARADTLDGIHVSLSAGRGRNDVLEGKVPRPLGPHEQSQRQPLVREHPVTGERALYMCEYGQMDWVQGPIAGLEPGPHGEGAKLLEALMHHATQRRFVYVHEWARGDLLVWDNRCLVHAATWFDSDNIPRLMWRTTVSGNPGGRYQGEKKSWLPEQRAAE